MTDSTPLYRLVAAICAIVAIALAAATVRSPVETGTEGSGEGGSGGGASQPPAPEQPGEISVPPFLEWLFYVLIILLAVALVWYLLAHRREAVKLIAVGLLIGLVVMAIVYALFEFGLFGGELEPRERVPGSGGDGETPGDGDGGDGGGEATSFSPSSLLALLAVVAAVFLGGLFLSRGSDDAETSGTGASAETTDTDPDAETVAAVGTAAGQAADRIEGGDEFDNAVYRAWREMTRPLEVERPESSTPREFATAAVDSGMDRDHVDELTELFETVRYGDAPTTPEREKRAIAVLERIEVEYADLAESVGATTADERADGGERR